jgi:monoamine oxidase
MAAVPLALAPGWARARPAKRAVVIGAGLSGLAAALRLVQRGWQPTVLDGRSSVGGRVFSYAFPQAPELVCELGAQWIGEDHHRLRAHAADFGLELMRHRFDEPMLLRDAVATPPGKWSFSPATTTALERIRARYERMSPRDKREFDRSDWWTALRDAGCPDDDLRLMDLVDSTDFGETIRMVGAFCGADLHFGANDTAEMDYKIVGGNSRLVDGLADRVGRERIRLRHRVTRVVERGGVVTVTAIDDATGQEVQLVADAVVCTAPIRALREITFDPPLPAAQRAAADELQYARIVKTHVLCDERFWGDEAFAMVSDRTSHYYFHSTQGQTGMRGILCAYAIGEKADVLAAQSDERRMRMVLDDMAPFVDEARRHGIACAAYAWQRDPWTQGAYAFFRPGQFFTARPALAAPHGHVVFAGEHLADWVGFMEGAVVSGEAAADQIAGPVVRRRVG